MQEYLLTASGTSSLLASASRGERLIQIGMDVVEHSPDAGEVGARLGCQHGGWLGSRVMMRLRPRQQRALLAREGHIKQGCRRPQGWRTALAIHPALLKVDGSGPCSAKVAG